MEVDIFSIFVYILDTIEDGALKGNNDNCWSLAFGCASLLCVLCGFAREICERTTCEWFVLILTLRYAESRKYPNIGAQDQPCVWRRELMTKTSKTLAVMQGLRPLFLLRCRLAPKQASANRHRRRNSLRSSGLHHSKENLENRLAQCFAFRDSEGYICRAQQLKIRSYIRDSN